jgi:hypothetical protein
VLSHRPLLDDGGVEKEAVDGLDERGRRVGGRRDGAPPAWRVWVCCGRVEGGGRAAALQRFLAEYLVGLHKTSHSAEERRMRHPFQNLLLGRLLDVELRR